MLGGYLVPLLVSSGSGRIELALLYIWVLTLFFSLWLLAVCAAGRWLWLGVIGGSLVVVGHQPVGRNRLRVCARCICSGWRISAVGRTALRLACCSR